MGGQGAWWGREVEVKKNGKVQQEETCHCTAHEIRQVQLKGEKGNRQFSACIYLRYSVIFNLMTSNSMEYLL